MRPAARLAFLLAYCAVPLPARANPCVLEYVAGRNLLAPAPQPDIFIAREEIRLALRTHHEWVKYPNGRVREPVLEGEVSVSYQLDNRGPARQAVIGFPIGLYNGGDSPFPNVVSRFRATGPGAGKLLPSGEGTGLTLERAALDRCERENSKPTDTDVSKAPIAPQYAWYVWPQSFVPGLNNLHVRYHMKALSAEAGWDAQVTIGYVLKTTAGWGDGKIGRLDILFSETGSGGRWKVLFGPQPLNVTREPRRLQWRLEAFSPDEDLRLAFTPAGDDFE